MLTIKNKNNLFFLILFSLVFPVSFIFGAEVFNSSATDNPLRVGNYTQSSGTQNWQTSLTGVNPGDKLRFSVYYRNDGTKLANNAVIRIDLSPSGDSSSFTATSKISATGFTDYIKTASINIVNPESINFTNTATWYHNYNGSVYQISTVPVTVSGNTVSYNLGVINQGYAPNDGYLIFDAYVSPLANAGNDQTVSAGSNVNLNASSSIGASSYSWNCPGLSLSSNNTVNPSFTAPNVSSATTYTCTLTVTNLAGMTGTDTVNISVSPTVVVTSNPVVSAGSSKTLTSGQSVTLSGTATHPNSLAMTYNWVCSGGVLSSPSVLQPTFYAPNVSSTKTYKCTLTVTDTANKSASSITNIIVNPAPIVTSNPVVSAGPNKTVISGQSVTLSGTATHPNSLAMTYSWSCNGGNLSNQSVLQPVFYAPSVTTSATYNCTLTATDTANKSSSSITYVTVNPTTPITSNPVASAGPSKTVTSGQSVTLSGTATHPNSLSMTYNWVCSGGSLSNSAILQPVFYAPSVSGTTTYNCTLTAIDSIGKSDSSITNITVNPAPIVTSNPVVSAGPNKTVISGQSVTLSGTATHPNSLAMTYSWSCNGGNLSNQSVLQPVFYAPSVSGTTTYNCTLTVTDTANKSASSITYVTVNPAPIVTSNPVVSAGPSKTVISGQSVTLSGTATHPNSLAMTYSWSCNGGNLSNQSVLQPVFYAPSVSGTTTYNCTLTVTDTANKSASSITYVTVNPAPIVTSNPVVSAGPNKTVISGQSVTLSGTATHPNSLAMTYSWSCNGGNLSNQSVLQPVFYAPSVSGTTTYNCTLTVTDTANKSASSITYVTVNPAPIVTSNPVVSAGSSKTVNSGQSVTLSGTATHPNSLAMTYSWSCSGGNLSSTTTLQPLFYAPSVSGTTTYNCTLTATDTANKSASSITYITVNPTSSTISNPVVSAGPNKNVLSSQATILDGTATHPNYLSMSYNWSCNGGSLSNSGNLQPTFYAPAVSSTTTYYCTLTATDTAGNSASSITYVVVTPTSSYSSNYYPVVNAGYNKSVQGGQSVVLDGTSSHYGGLQISYHWSCNGGTLSSSSALQPTFYAPNVYSTETISCTLSGTDTAGRTATSITYITVNPSSSSSNYYSSNVSAGPSKTISSGQSVILEGSVNYNNYYSVYNYSYRWSCSGGSLSNSTSLQPTFYAPNISYTTTYNCTLTATDYNGRTLSSVTYITVNQSGYSSSDFKVSTNVAENVTSSTATLKGLITNSSYNNISVRFNWGRDSQYINNTPWVYNKGNGDIISYAISGLEKGKAYSYRVEASNGSRTIYGENVTFVTKPNPVTGLTALASGSNKINLTWNRDSDSCYTMIVRKTGSYPSHGADGTVIYYGSSNSYLDQNISNNVWYYYKAWAVGCDQGLTSFSDSSQSRAYTITDTPTYIAPTTTVISGANIDFFARNITKNQVYWGNIIDADLGDVIDFQIVITPTGEKSLSNVKVVSSFANGIVSVDDYQSSLSKEVNVGSIKLGNSETISFRGKITENGNIMNQLNSMVQVSATGLPTIEKVSTINISQGLSNLGSMIDIFNIGSLGWLLILLIIMMLVLIMYLVIDRNRKKEECEEVKVEKSRYFNIK